MKKGVKRVVSLLELTEVEMLNMKAISCFVVLVVSQRGLFGKS